MQLISTAVFRDYSAWYHLVAIYDSANATSTERVRLYVNGVRLTAFGTATYPSLNQAPTGDFLTDMQIGRTNTNASNQNYGDGYLTEMNFIDGQALDPSYFGETDAITGVWKPKKYAGTYGTNGWYLNFSDNSGVTATTIGKDYSGNGNNWTPTNISITAGVTYDSMIDVPTQWADGGNGRGNYAVLNSAAPAPGSTSITEANLAWAQTATNLNRAAIATFGMSSGKWYWEYSVGTSIGANNSIYIGIAQEGFALTNYCGATTTSWGYTSGSGNKVTNGSGSAYGATFTSNDVIGFTFDADVGTLTAYKNGVSQGTMFTSLTSSPYFPVVSESIGGGGTTSLARRVNFGQRPFTYTPPTGFLALNTLNLPTPTILKDNQYFDASLWTGDQSARTITNTGGFQPDFLWTKSRSFAEGHRLSDAVRGGNGTVLRTLSSNTTDAEAVDTDVTGFTSSGFNIRAGTNTPNVTGRTYVGWQWKEGATQGFDIVTYTGDATTNRTVAHSLGVTPSMFIIKARSAGTTSWIVHHKDLGNNGGSPAYLQYLLLESTAAKAASTSLLPVAGLSSTTFPTSGATNNTNVNGNGTTYIAYLFSKVAGFSKFGSYTGNGSADGPFVFLGFRPAFVMIKRTDAANDWVMMDELRLGYNQVNTYLEANTSDAEATDGGGSGSRSLDMLSNGFKLRETAAATNASGGTYIYAAFAENPFKNALAR